MKLFHETSWEGKKDKVATIIIDQEEPEEEGEDGVAPEDDQEKKDKADVPKMRKFHQIFQEHSLDFIMT